MDQDVKEGMGLMVIAAGAGGGIAYFQQNPVRIGIREGLTFGTVAAALVTVFSTKHRTAAAVTTAVGVAGLLTESLIP